jgi:hypothetical protein
MKRLVLVAVLLLGAGVSARADNSVYVYTSKTPRSDADLQAAGSYCDGRLGPVMNGEITPARYKQCMLSRGWRYQSTTRVRTPPVHTWIDPDTGDTCHDILGGLGSSCGNF